MKGKNKFDVVKCFCEGKTVWIKRNLVCKPGCPYWNNCQRERKHIFDVEAIVKRIFKYPFGKPSKKHLDKIKQRTIRINNGHKKNTKESRRNYYQQREQF